jgi:hypothetical protein
MSGPQQEPSLDLSQCPPVPRDLYETVATLAASGQLPEARLAELLQDKAFAAWFRARSDEKAAATGPDGRHLTRAEFEALPTETNQIAAMARSLRATLLRDRPPDLPVSAGELANAVELIELLADEVGDLAERVAGRIDPLKALSN